jgi:hypothetical protein
MLLFGSFITYLRLLADLRKNEKRRQNIELALAPGKGA